MGVTGAKRRMLRRIVEDEDTNLPYPAPIAGCPRCAAAGHLNRVRHHGDSPTYQVVCSAIPACFHGKQFGYPEGSDKDQQKAAVDWWNTRP